MIRLQGLRVRAGDFSLAIDDLSVASGEYLMILGPTASGKTVLLETIAGLRRPREGRVWYGERDVTDAPPERRGAGLVYQDYALFPHLTVAENIGFGLRAHAMGRGRNRDSRGPAGEDGRFPWDSAAQMLEGRVRLGGVRPGNHKDRVHRLAGLLGIDGLLARYPEGLSGGERQRVALARALAIEPEVLLLDEPLSALDGPTRLELRAELRRVHGELRATVMHVTHDLDEAMVLGDRVAVMVNGEIRQEGTPQRVTRFPVDVEVARLVGLANVFPVAELLGDVPEVGKRLNVVALENGCTLAVEVGPLPPSPEGLFAVIRADEIELVPDRHQGTGIDEGSGIADGDTLVEGLITGVQLHPVHASVDVELRAGGPRGPVSTLTVHVLRSQVETTALAGGQRTRVRIPAGAVHLCPMAASPGAV